MRTASRVPGPIRSATADRALIRMLPDGRRVHMHDGPIDLIVEAFGDGVEITAAYRAAAKRFVTVLDELCGELAFLRQQTREDGPLPDGPIAQRMTRAVRPHAEKHFITPMAAVAGAVAEEILDAMTAAAKLSRAYVNDGGDIALYLRPGEMFTAGMVNLHDVDLCKAAVWKADLSINDRVVQDHGSSLFGTTTIAFDDPFRGIATSGWRGRSFSLGIADAVTVLADTAAAADAAATIVANAVNLPGHPQIERTRACDLVPDSDLGERLVTRSVPHLLRREIREALDSGVGEAESLRAAGLIRGAAISLQGEVRVVGDRRAPNLMDIVSNKGSLVHA